MNAPISPTPTIFRADRGHTEIILLQQLEYPSNTDEPIKVTHVVRVTRWDEEGRRCPHHMNIKRFTDACKVFFDTVRRNVYLYGVHHGEDDEPGA